MSLTEVNVACAFEFFCQKIYVVATPPSATVVTGVFSDMPEHRSASEHHENEVNRLTSSSLPPLSTIGTATESNMQGHEWYRFLLLFQACGLYIHRWASSLEAQVAGNCQGRKVVGVVEMGFGLI
ncbi:hypothetical protein GQ457_17G015420 [Hibiscus cannabinus]